MPKSTALILVIAGILVLLNIKTVIMGVAWLGFASLQVYLIAFILGIINMALKFVGIRFNMPYW